MSSEGITLKQFTPKRDDQNSSSDHQNPEDYLPPINRSASQGHVPGQGQRNASDAQTYDNTGYSPDTKDNINTQNGNVSTTSQYVFY